MRGFFDGAQNDSKNRKYRVPSPALRDQDDGAREIGDLRFVNGDWKNSNYELRMTNDRAAQNTGILLPRRGIRMTGREKLVICDL